jgi:hypothetical protein
MDHDKYREAARDSPGALLTDKRIILRVICYRNHRSHSLRDGGPVGTRWNWRHDSGPNRDYGIKKISVDQFPLRRRDADP